MTKQQTSEARSGAMAPDRVERVAAARRPTAQIEQKYEKEEQEVLMHPYHEELERGRRREQREELRLQRLVAQARPARSERRLSRALGRQMIRLGSLLAAEPVREGARLP